MDGECLDIECEISLSKKLRAIIGNQGSIGMVIIANDVKDGKGRAIIKMESGPSDDGFDINILRQSIGKETSIQFTPISIRDEDVPTESITNLFSTAAQPVGPRTAVDRLAATEAPDKNQVAHAIKRQEEIETPEVFPEYKEPEFQAFVSNFQELMMAVKAAQGKESEIDLDSIEDPRQRALAAEMKEQAEAIDIPAYIVNDTCSSVTLNDIDLSLGLNMPFNLANISAKRLASSGDLKSMLRSNHIKFINPNDVDSYRQMASAGVDKPGLETYSTRGEAEDAIGQDDHIPQAEQVDIPVDDTTPSEQEQLAGLINLTPMSDEGANGVRTTFHGVTAPRTKNVIGNTSTANPQGIKTISKAQK